MYDLQTNFGLITDLLPTMAKNIFRRKKKNFFQEEEKTKSGKKARFRSLEILNNHGQNSQLSPPTHLELIPNESRRPGGRKRTGKMYQKSNTIPGSRLAHPG